MRTCRTTIGLLLAALIGITAAQSWAEETKPAAEKATATSPTYVCPMHPQIQATFPGVCPLCKMAMKAKVGGEAATTNGQIHSHAVMPMNGMDMNGMGMMNCPSCRMGMGSMSASPAAPAGVIKAAPSGYRTVGGRRCGC